MQIKITILYETNLLQNSGTKWICLHITKCTYTYTKSIIKGTIIIYRHGFRTVPALVLLLIV